MAREPGTWETSKGHESLAPPLSSCEFLGQLLNLSVAQSLYL